MGAGHGDAGAQAHELRQHLGPGNDRNAPLPGGQHFRIVGGHGRGFDHHVGVAQVVPAMADGDGGPEAAQAADGLTHGQIRA